jgi:hypothetical protein
VILAAIILPLTFAGAAAGVWASADAKPTNDPKIMMQRILFNMGDAFKAVVEA